MFQAKDTKPFFIKMIGENLYVALPKKIFFKKILIRKCRYIRLIQNEFIK